MMLFRFVGPQAVSPGRAGCNRAVAYGQGAAGCQFLSLFNNLFALPTASETISFRLFRYWDAIMLRDKLNEAMKEAMRARDTAALGTIRLILAKLKDVDIAARTEASREGVADDKILSMMQGMIKQRNEFIALYEKGGRPELAEKEGRDHRDRALPAAADGRGRRSGRRRRRHQGRRRDLDQGHGRRDGGVEGQVRRSDGLRQASAVVKKTLAG